MDFSQDFLKQEWSHRASKGLLTHAVRHGSFEYQHFRVALVGLVRLRWPHISGPAPISRETRGRRVTNNRFDWHAEQNRGMLTSSASCYVVAVSVRRTASIASQVLGPVPTTLAFAAQLPLGRDSTGCQNRKAIDWMMCLGI